MEHRQERPKRVSSSNADADDATLIEPVQGAQRNLDALLDAVVTLAKEPRLEGTVPGLSGSSARVLEACGSPSQQYSGRMLSGSQRAPPIWGISCDDD